MGNITVSNLKPFIASRAALVVCAENPIHLILPCSFALENCFHRPAGTQRLLHIGRPHQVVQLVQIKVIGLEQLQRLLQLLSRAALSRRLVLQARKYLLAVQALEAHAHFGFALALAVGGRHIEVVEPAVEGVVDRRGALLLFDSGSAPAREIPPPKASARSGPARGVGGPGASRRAARRQEWRVRSRPPRRQRRPQS